MKIPQLALRTLCGALATVLPLPVLAQDLPHPLPADAPMNAVQVIGTHNSYKQAIAPSELAAIAAADARARISLDYAHPPLATQLDAGARSLELDALLDPAGGLYADPLGQKVPADLAGLRGAGIKTLHVQDIDYRSHCHLFRQCLAQVDAWSRAHPDHAPLIITINLKEGPSPVPGGAFAPEWAEEGFDALDAEIAGVFAPERLIRPDDLRGDANTLREAVLGQGWPQYRAAQGRVMFVLDAGKEHRALYRRGRANLAGLPLFVPAESADDAEAAVFILNDPLAEGERIRELVAAGFIVRTRADADTLEARANDTGRRDAALASGAHVITTDYIFPRSEFGPYQVAFAEGGAVRANPVVGATGN